MSTNKLLLSVLIFSILLVTGLLLLINFYPRQNSTSKSKTSAKITPKQSDYIALNEGVNKLNRKYKDDEAKTLENAANLKEKCYPLVTLNVSTFDKRSTKIIGNTVEISYKNQLVNVTYTDENDCKYTHLTMRARVKGSKPYVLTLPTGLTFKQGETTISPLVYDILKNSDIDFALTYEKTDTPDTYRLIKWQPKTFYVM